MRKNQLTLLLFLLSFTINNYSQEKDQYNTENIKLKLVYQLGLINMPTGEIEFSSNKKYCNNVPGLCLEACYISSKSFELFYKYIGYCQAQLDLQNNQLVNFRRKVNQNGALFEECYNFDSNRNQIYSKILPDKQLLKQDTLPLQKDVFDFLSASQFIRHLKFENMKQGNRVPIKILIDNKLYPLYIKYSGIERINLPNGNSYVCYKIAVQVIEGDVFKGGEALTAWISADCKRLPVQCEAKIQVGLVKATLAEVKYQTTQLLSIKSTIN